MAIRNLSNLRAPKKANENKKRVGRGMGSGMGKTSTRGHKGQGSRSGSSLMRGFEGGQMPLHRRLPKRGFTNIFRVEYTVLGLDRVAEINAASNETEFTLDKIIALGLLRKKNGLIKVLNNGEIKAAVTVHAHKFSKTAQEAIEKAGGKAILIGQAVGLDSMAGEGMVPRIAVSPEQRFTPEVSVSDVRENRKHLPHPRPPQARPVHAWHAGRLSSRIAHPDPRHQRRHAGAVLQSELRLRAWPGRSLLRRKPSPSHGLRPRHHAVHHGVDHLPAAHRHL